MYWIALVSDRRNHFGNAGLYEWFTLFVLINLNPLWKDLKRITDFSAYDLSLL